MGRKKGRKKRLARLIILLSIIFITWYLLGNHGKNKKITIEELLPSPKTSSILCQEYKILNNSPKLKQVVQSQLIGTKGTYGIVIKNLKTSEEYSQNESQIFDSASLYKLWVMTEVYNQISKGKLKQEYTLSTDYSVLNEEFYIDPRLAEKGGGKFTTTVGQALAQMITVSDNYSALILTKAISKENLYKFLSENCFTDSRVGVNGKPPVTSPRDVALFFEKLYTGKLADKEQTENMVNLLKQQKFIDKIPKYLPYKTQLSIAHKTGELEPYSHDGGIVYSPNGNYIIVVMSKSDSRDLANERIANVSKAVYNYFNYLENSPQASESAK